MPFAYRNADADLIYFVHRGGGRMATDFGDLAYEQGDYVVLPRGTTHRIFPDGDDSFLLVIAAYEMPQLPPADRMGQHSPYDRAVLRLPELPLPGGPPNSDGEWELVIEREGQWSRVFYPFDPIDTVGWKGDLSAFALNVRDIRPVTSGRFHLPPSVHTTLRTSGFVLCTFAPRRIEGLDDPAAAVRLPFYHRNIDYDEALFHHAGQPHEPGRDRRRDDDLASPGDPSRPPAQGGGAGPPADQDSPRRVRGDDRRGPPAASNGRERSGGNPGLRGVLDAPHRRRLRIGVAPCHGRHPRAAGKLTPRVVAEVADPASGAPRLVDLTAAGELWWAAQGSGDPVRWAASTFPRPGAAPEGRA